MTFDLETKVGPDDVEDGWDGLRRGDGGVSCLTLWDSTSERPYLFDESTLDVALDFMERANIILTFNGVDFDIPCMEGVLERRLPPTVQHIDLLQVIWDSLPIAANTRKCYTLGELGERTLGISKSGSGAMAPILYAEGRWGELLDYCLGDTMLTRKLFLHAQKHGSIIDRNGEPLELKLPDWFGEVSL